MSIRRWEYKTIPNCTERVLNDLGEKGWELVSINEVNPSGGGFYAYTFKKEKLVH